MNKLKEASKKALNRYVKPHALRGSRATQLEENGANVSTIRDFLGHDNIATTNRYLINTPQKLKDAVRKAENG